MNLDRIQVAIRLIVVASCAALCLGACSAPPPPRFTPTAAATPTPVATPVPTLDPATSDIQDAFLMNVNDLTSDVETLATASCADITAETRANPTEITEIRGFAATMQRLGGSQAALDSDDVRGALTALNHALGQMDAALETCNIPNP